MNPLADYEGEVPGAALLVIRDGVVVTRECAGYADLESRVPVTPATNFRLASITKQFTAAAILELGLEHDPSIQQLLTHTSGLVDYEHVLDSDEQVDDTDIPRLISGHPRYFEPGTAFRYSNTGYTLLTLVIERQSGLSFADFLRARIFEPLGMHDTTVGPPAANRAYGYSLLAEDRQSCPSRVAGETGQAGLPVLHQSAWTRTDQDRTSATRGDGGIYSSIDDLAKWIAALDRGLYAEACVPHAFNYGYGWRIDGDTVWHNGESIGFRNVIIREPRTRSAVVMLTNRNEPEPYAAALPLLARV